MRLKKKRIDPLWNEVINTTNVYTTALEGSEVDKSNAIEDAKMHLELIELKWEQFFALKLEINRKISDLEKILLVKQSKNLWCKTEPGVKNLVNRVPAVTSHDAVVPDNVTEVTKTAVSNSDNNESDSDTCDENIAKAEVQSTLQVTSNQSGPADVDKTDKGLINQNRDLFELNEKNGWNPDFN